MSIEPKKMHSVSVIVPESPFAPDELRSNKPYLCAIDVEKLMDWWPGKPYYPYFNVSKVRSIQRSLDWKRVAQIAAYLLQKEIVDAPTKLVKYFDKIYKPKKNEPGREWPPKVSKVVGFEKSEYPVFSNVLLHVNGATFKKTNNPHIANLTFDETKAGLDLTVIDGQHRINGGYFALMLLQETCPNARWEIPAEIFVDLDPPESHKRQAQIFIDVNFYQRKVDRSLVADLFTVARGDGNAIGNIERAQDIGRRLMLETGPLVGMIQIPGIKFGVKDVITLSTLNNALEDVIQVLDRNNITGLESQIAFIAMCLSAWLEATGRTKDRKSELDNQNVVYQGRILVSVLNLLPAIVWHLRKENVGFGVDEANAILVKWFKRIIECSGLQRNGRFIEKSQFKKMGFLGSGGIARFRNLLWASIQAEKKIKLEDDIIEALATKNRAKVMKNLGIE